MAADRDRGGGACRRERGEPARRVDLEARDLHVDQVGRVEQPQTTRTNSPAPASNTSTSCSTGSGRSESLALQTATAIGNPASTTIRRSKTPPNDSQPVDVGIHRRLAAARPLAVEPRQEHADQQHQAASRGDHLAEADARGVQLGLVGGLDGGVRRRGWRRRWWRSAAAARRVARSCRCVAKLHATHDHHDRPDQAEEDAELLSPRPRTDRTIATIENAIRLAVVTIVPGAAGRFAVFPVKSIPPIAIAIRRDQGEDDVHEVEELPCSRSPRTNPGTER